MNLRSKQKIKKKELYSEYVRVLNGILRLSNREAEVLSLLLAADDLADPEDINKHFIREAITKKLGISEANLSKYLHTLKEKKLLVRGPTGKWVINDHIRPIKENSEKNEIIEITITLEIDETFDNNFRSFSDYILEESN